MTAIVTGTIQVPKESVNKNLIDRYVYTYQGFQGEVTVRNFKSHKGFYYFPRNLKKFRKHSDLKFKYLVTEGTPLEFSMKLPPLEHQVKPINDVVKAFKSDVNVLLKAETRFGKTYSAINIMQNLGVSTLILVDKTLLVEQFIKDCKEYSTLNLKSLTNYDEKDVEVAYISTFQYLNANPNLINKIKNKFGLVIVDECQVLTADTYRDTLYSFNSRYRLGISATPSAKQRGLTNLITDSVGEIKVEGKYDGVMVKTYIHRLPLTFTFNQLLHSSEQMADYFTSDEVVESIKSILISIKEENPKARVLIATPYQALHDFYFEVSQGLGYSPAILNSQSKNKKLKEINLEKLDKGEVDLLLGLNQITKGWSGKLDVIIDLFAVSSEENAEQLVGRLRTPYKGKPTPKYIQLYSAYPTYKNKAITRMVDNLSFTIFEGEYNAVTC